jgi:hypothetical protein
MGCNGITGGGMGGTKGNVDGANGVNKAMHLK